MLVDLFDALGNAKVSKRICIRATNTRLYILILELRPCGEELHCQTKKIIIFTNDKQKKRQKWKPRPSAGPAEML